MRNKSLCICILFLLISVGCGKADSNSESPHIEGLIYSQQENNILVIEEIDSVDIPQEEWQGKPAYFVTLTSDTQIQDQNSNKLDVRALVKGDQVKVWHTGTILESYPMQVTAVKIIVTSK